MTEQGLKLCPFCGSTDIDTRGFGTGPPDMQVDGHLCSCGAAPGETGERAWNTRPIEDALTAESAALKERLEKVERHLYRVDMSLSLGLDRDDVEVTDRRRIEDALPHLREAFTAAALSPEPCGDCGGSGIRLTSNSLSAGAYRCACKRTGTEPGEE